MSTAGISSYMAECVSVRNVIMIGVSTLVGIMTPSYAIAQIDVASLRDITNVVQEMCLHPDRIENYIQVEDESDAGIRVIILDLNISGTISREGWQGINERIDQYRDDTRECIVQVLTIFIETFTPRLPDPLTVDEIHVVLEDIIREFYEGYVDRSRFTNYLFLEIDTQRTFIVSALRESGELEEVRLLGSQGNEKIIYSFMAYHERSSFLWTISTNNKGIVDMLYVHLI